jgi:hypothetical protein
MVIAKAWGVSTRHLAGLELDRLNGTEYQTHYIRAAKTANNLETTPLGLATATVPRRGL